MKDRLRVVPSGCWEWQGHVGANGYGYVAVTPGHPDTVHRQMWIAVNGSIPAGLFVLHRCDNRRCGNPKHLFLGPQSANVADMWAKGRQQTYSNMARGDAHPLVRDPGKVARGERNGLAALNESAVRTIRGQPSRNASLLAAQFGVTRMAIWRARTGRTWAHVK